MAEIKNYTLTFVHSTRLRTVCSSGVELDGEVVQRADPHIRLSAVQTEKLAETQNFYPVAALHGSAGLRIYDDVQRARLLPGD